MDAKTLIKTYNDQRILCNTYGNKLTKMTHIVRHMTNLEKKEAKSFGDL